MKADILIIGGGPAGIVSAVTARQKNPKKTITLVRREEKAVIPCGLPYIFKRLKSIDEDIMPDNPLKKANVNLLIDEAVRIEVKKKKVVLKKGEEIGYKKLILASGSETQLIPVQGIDYAWQIKKDYQYLSQMRRALNKAREIVIIGGGFIGVELAEELSGFKNKEISIIEILDHCLSVNFDDEFAEAAERKLKEKGVNIYTGVRVKKISQNKKIKYVVLSNGKKIRADEIVLSIGARPNVELAEKAEIRVEPKGAVKVDSYMRTSAKDVFAVGDCAQTRDFITGKKVPIMLASVACAEARIAAANLYKAKVRNPGTVGAFSTFINGLTLGAVGFTQKRAKTEGIDILIGKAEVPNHHPSKLPGTGPIIVKLIFSRKEKLLIGAELMGPESVAELTNVLSLAIQRKITASQLAFSQFATHPLLTPAPTVYPLISASLEVLGK